MPAPIKLSSKATREFWEIPVLWEDAHLLALNKPSRLLTSPDRYDPERPNLMRLLHDGIHRGSPWAVERGLTYLANAHRLDFETTGVLLLARDKPSLVHLADQFGSGKPIKHYRALVAGRPRAAAFEVKASLAPHPSRPGWMRVDPAHGKKSITRFRVVETFAGYALLECEPLTGRTHQIRVHLRHVGLPIVGDSTYGGVPLWLSRLKRDYRLAEGRKERPLLDRTGLHAASLSVVHPVSQETVIVEAPTPKDLEVSLKYLRRFAAGS